LRYALNTILGSSFGDRYAITITIVKNPITYSKNAKLSTIGSTRPNHVVTNTATPTIAKKTSVACQFFTS
jgi:hypothetical protein